ncbi:hypothetical protein BpHYR1_053897 [Brachionus plicatilis]|uniref:Uncharacterized protein n=1 Tax=Brachionus plicatilis TaxID=10195 RepID=A0A3M7T1D5_BRAPC|nr:hypothetical protein BpHYR1_053897 [Brachionus plicatilis]
MVLVFLKIFEKLSHRRISQIINNISFYLKNVKNRVILVIFWEKMVNQISLQDPILNIQLASTIKKINISLNSDNYLI